MEPNKKPNFIHKIFNEFSNTGFKKEINKNLNESKAKIRENKKRLV